MALTVGSRLGHYHVTALIGEGGMGEVYRATDTLLHRDVALKILPDAFAADPDRLARFQREAQVLASLNHPNIAQIHGIEKSEDTQALVLELVEGPTLADRIAKGPIPLDEALPIAKQIAEALEAAHEAGVIHRDLKPANIKVREDGTVKVLDFGLAKALDTTPQGDPSQSPTLTAAATQMGVIMGTAAYMSPEQAKGKVADKRADVWAFGVVFYEMLTGQRAFDGDDVADTLAAILRAEPSWDALPAGTPLSIRTLLRRCAQRDVRKRLPHIGVARLDIEEGHGASADTVTTAFVPVPAGAGRRRSAILIGSGLLAGMLLSGAGVGMWLSVRPTPAVDPIHFTVPAPDQQAFPLGRGASLNLSPDGRRLAFVTGTSRRQRRVWIRSLGSVTAQAVAGTEGAFSPLWAPDGTSITFGTLDGLRRIDTSGGPPLTLAALDRTSVPLPGAWSREGIILYQGGDGRVYRVADSGGEAVPVTELDATREEVGHYPEFFLSDGRRFVFRAQSRDPSKNTVYLTSLGSSSRAALVDVLSNVGYADGHLVYQREGSLMVQPFDDNAGRVTGPAAPVLEGVAYNPITGNGAFSVSGSGVLAYRAEDSAGTSLLTWFDREGEQLESIADFVGGFDERPALSTDGRRLVVSRREGGGGPADLWMVDLDRGVPTRFTFDPAHDAYPDFSPDGTRVVFHSDRNGVADLYERASGGAADDSLLYESPVGDRPEAFSPDGAVLLFSHASNRPGEIWALAMEGDPEPVPVVRTGFPAGHAVFSPDGRWFAYCEGDSGGDQVYVQPYPPDGTRVRLSTTSGSSPQWSGTEVFYVTYDNQVMAVDVTDPLQPGVAMELFVAPGTFFHQGILADSSGSRFLLPVATEERQIAHITVVTNWLGEFLTRVSVN